MLGKCYSSRPGIHARITPSHRFVKGIEHIGDIADADMEGMFATNVLGLIRLTQIFVKGDSSSVQCRAVWY